MIINPMVELELRDRLAAKDKDIEYLKKKLAEAYDDCIDAVNKIKDDPITDMGSHHRLQGSFQTAKTWMVAIAEDIEREIVARKEKNYEIS